MARGLFLIIDIMEYIRFDDNGIRRILRLYGSSFEEKEKGLSVLGAILDYAKTHLGCKTAVVENEYICKDFRSEFSVLYSKQFAAPSSLATRLHFFEAELENDEEILNLRKDLLGYCGYVVIRPTKICRVGRSILKTAKHDENREYCICISKSRIHILGRQFEIEGTPFIQQDSMLMCCAHSAMWVCTRYMQEAFAYPEVLPHEISENASLSYITGTRALPTEGLSNLDILNGFLNLGYSPILFSKPRREEYYSTTEYEKALKHWHPVRNIYRWVESGFPVVACVPGHSFTIVGHTLHPKRWNGKLENEVFENIYAVFSDQWVDGFLANDDAAGPYRLLPAEARDRKRLLQTKLRGLVPSGEQPYRTALKDINAYVVPLPSKVYILSEHIEDIVKGLIENRRAVDWFLFTQIVADTGNKMARQFLDSMNNKDNPLVFRCYVTESAKYKRRLRSLPNKSISAMLRYQLTYMRMPRYVWVIEITNAEYMSKPTHRERKILGQMLIDTTGNKYAMPALAIHVPGNLFIPRDEQCGDYERIEIPHDHVLPMPTRREILGAGD